MIEFGTRKARWERRNQGVVAMLGGRGYKNVVLAIWSRWRWLVDKEKIQFSIRRLEVGNDYLPCQRQGLSQ